MKPAFFMLFTLIIIISCELNDRDLVIPVSETLDTTILSTDTLTYSFGYYGDEEGISVNYQSQEVNYCNIIMNNYEERVLIYIPEEAFIGVDSLILVSYRGSDGASPPTDIDTIHFIINVISSQPSD